MRRIGSLIVPLLTVVLILLLDRKPPGSLPALGRLLDPVNGWAANAASEGDNRELSLKDLKQPVTVWFEERMVPHIHAENASDLYFAQGYLHARFRLWQMEFQTHAAAGRLGEIIGEKWVIDERTRQRKNAILEFDRGQRRKGMIYAAENSLKEMEADARTKQMLDAYTAGVNHYISSLSFRDYPLEYKLMGYAPEPWTNLKCALLLKTMADDLTGYTEDFPLTLLKEQLSREEFEFLFPQRLNESTPVIPEGTRFDTHSLSVPEAPNDTVWSQLSQSLLAVRHFSERPDAIGSNSWAISGTHTVSGAPILCNDPHLGLNLPSLWFEMQLQSPEMNVYGVSLPGAPGVIIGFNDSISWGFTNNYRDVKDFYEIEVVDRDFYRFDKVLKPFDKRVEVIKIKGKSDYIDTVLYTIHGPVCYDTSFSDPLRTGKMFAVQWMAHRGTNELLAVHLLNRATDYVSFTGAIMHFQCPAQNMIYADRAGNIAMWGQGQFINKWKDQGRYVMKGNTSATLWGADIPMIENPHVLNPPQGYLASANQITTDSTYPYWYNGYFYDFRAWRINEILKENLPKDVAANMQMQNDVVSVLARGSVSRLVQLASFEDSTILPDTWNHTLDAKSNVAANFQLFWTMFYDRLWKEAFSSSLAPSSERTMQLLNLDSGANPYYAQMKRVAQEARGIFLDSIDKLRNSGQEWYKVKGTQLTHLARLDAFNYKNLNIGGWGNTINAVKKTHGPSWRMIVEMRKDSIVAWGVYPGGQSGNPGSKHYGTFVNHWVEGKYYRLNFLPNQSTQKNNSIRYIWNLKP